MILHFELILVKFLIRPNQIKSNENGSNAKDVTYTKQQVQQKLFNTYPKNKTNLYALYKDVCSKPTIRKRSNLNCLGELVAYFNNIIKDEPGYNMIAPDKVERNLYNMLFKIHRADRAHNPHNFFKVHKEKLCINSHS